MVIDKLMCTSAGSQASDSDSQVHDALYDATQTEHIPNSITALLHHITHVNFQVDHHIYVHSKTVGFLSHKDIFEFIEPDRYPVCIDIPQY